ncbi:MAG: hypothetical protein IPL32_02845 [Chloracidobacterium sp.]|nr:hypothetical protein [Chloracidobacterium sp.]
MKKKKLKAELSKTKKKLADVKAKLKAVESTPTPTLTRKTAANTPNAKEKSVAAKPARSTVKTRSQAKKISEY